MYRGLGPAYTGTVPCERTRTVRIGLAFTWELMEPFHTELLVVPELVHLESRSRMEPNQKFSSGTLRNEARGKLTEDS